MKPKYCPLCKGPLDSLSHRSFYCEKCKIVLQVHIEINGLDSPLLKNGKE